MKIKLKKDHYFGKFLKVKGTQMEVTAGLGKDLITQGIAVSTEFVSLTEKHAEKVSSDQASKLRDELPTKAKDLCKYITSCSNTVLLQELTGNSYKSVRTAALKRLEETK